jgi:hypothetical protein
MPEQVNTSTTESRGRTVLVKGEKGQIEPLVTEGIAASLSDLGGTYPAERVGVPVDPGYKYIDGSRSVQSDTLTPDAQDQLARELQDKPLRGDKVLADFDGETREATIDDYYKATDEVTGETKKYAIAVDKNGIKTGVHLEHLTLEYQGQLRKEGGAVLEAYGFKPQVAEQPNQFSYEAYLARQAKQTPSQENTGMEDIEGSDLEDLIQSLDPQKRARDRIELISYAIAKNTSLAIEAKGGDAKHYIGILDQNISRMSPGAKAIADQYARMYGLQEKDVA